jgi:signal transduction histidine kinase
MQFQSITFGIIDKHNGELLVDSKKGKGTEFTITIPKKQQHKFSPVMS